MSPSSLSDHRDLDALDDALLYIRRMWEHPSIRRWFLKELGVPVELATLRVLRAIERAEVAPSIGDVATMLTVDPSTASRLVDQATGAGFVRRSRTAVDRRRSELALTAEGQRLLTRATDIRRTRIAEVTATWHDEDVRALTELLSKFTQEVDRLRDDESTSSHPSKLGSRSSQLSRERQFVAGHLVRAEWCPADGNRVEVIVSCAPQQQFRWCFLASADTFPTQAASNYAIYRLGHRPIVIALDEHRRHMREASAIEAIERWRADGTVLVDKSLVGTSS